ncbi:MAG: hypothetical protein Q9M76_01025, partial [Candidatus Dojkabacteria bacterium]|nr:hypothetical protein [Candidatus Dojkabacteria bacterium]
GDFTMPALLISKTDPNPAVFKDNDSIICFNFGDNGFYPISRALEDDDFNYWNRKQLENIYYVGFTKYSEKYPNKVAFSKEEVQLTITSYLDSLGIKQVKYSEKIGIDKLVKYFNGDNGFKGENEEWVDIPTPLSVSSFDQLPGMNEEWLAEEVVDYIKEKPETKFVLVNFVAISEVTKTGNIEATIKAVEEVDKSIGVLMNSEHFKDALFIVMSDHAGAEEMLNVLTGDKMMKNSTNDVPLVIAAKDLDNIDLPNGELKDIAPTILKLFGIEIPPDMTGRSLIPKK